MWKRNYINTGINLTKLQVLKISEFLTVLNSIQIQGNLNLMYTCLCCRVDILLLYTPNTKISACMTQVCGFPCGSHVFLS
jgi:hypothetical protein